MRYAVSHKRSASPTGSVSARLQRTAVEASQLKLRPGGRAFDARDHRDARRPAVQVEQLGQLGEVGTFADLTP